MKKIHVLGRLMSVAVLVTAVLLSGHAVAQAKFVLISHAPDSDSWWNTIKNAIKQAGEDFDVQVDYRNPPNGDLSDMARLIEQAAAKEYDGVIVTIADYDVLKSAIGKVINKGIPVVTINSGTPEQSEQLNAIMHVGQPEYVAGKGAGEKAKEAGVKSFLCVNHYATNPASFDRCRGFGDALGVDFKSATIDTGEDPTNIQNKVSTFLRKNPATDGVITLGPTSAHPTIRALSGAGLLGEMWFASFDLSEEIAAGIKKGNIEFGIDQQPYLQGYIPVAVLASVQGKNTDAISLSAIQGIHKIVQSNTKAGARFAKYGLKPNYGERHINSGPGFVTKKTIGLVEKHAGQYR